ncbi:MAG: flagellar biosynthetic protein FliR [Acidobacteriota bacterium]
MALEWTASYLGGLVLGLGRLGGLVTFAPFFSSGVVPRQIRVILAFVLTFSLFPLIEDAYAVIPRDLLGFFLILVREFLVGCVIGLTAKIVFAAMDVAGQVMGFQVGFGFIHAVDPQTQVESPFMSLLLNLTALVLFLQLGGHHWLIEAVVRSYDSPIWGARAPGALLDHFVPAVAEAFRIGFQIAAPLVVMMFVADILFGVLGRTAPQIHILVVGMSGKLLLGFFLLAATSYTLIPQVAHHVSGIEASLVRLLEILRE